MKERHFKDNDSNVEIEIMHWTKKEEQTKESLKIGKINLKKYKDKTRIREKRSTT